MAIIVQYSYNLHSKQYPTPILCTFINSPAPTKGGGGAFAEFKARRVANLQRDLQAAKDAASAEGGVRPPSVKSTQQDTHHRPGRVPHRGGPPKQNFANKVLNPASKGNLSDEEGSGPKHSSGIPKLIHRKPIGHQVHDAEQLSSARPVGQRRSGRASVRGEMSAVTGELREIERFSNVPAPRAPVRERRGRSYLQQSHPTANLDQNLAKMHDYLSINHFAYNVDNQDDDGYDSDADLEPVCGPDDPDYMDVDNHEHVRNVDGKYIFDMDAQLELTPEEQAQGEFYLSATSLTIVLLFKTGRGLNLMSSYPYSGARCSLCAKGCGTWGPKTMGRHL